MKTKLTILTAFLIISCGSSEKTIYVWNMKDLIGLWLLLFILTIYSIICLFLWIKSFFKSNRNSKNR